MRLNQSEEHAKVLAQIMANITQEQVTIGVTKRGNHFFTPPETSLDSTKAFRVGGIFNPK